MTDIQSDTQDDSRYSVVRKQVNPTADDFYFIDEVLRENTTQEERPNEKGEPTKYTVLNEGATWDALTVLLNERIATEDRVFNEGHLRRRCGGRAFGPWAPWQWQKPPLNKTSDPRVDELVAQIREMDKAIKKLETIVRGLYDAAISRAATMTTADMFRHDEGNGQSRTQRTPPAGIAGRVSGETS